MKSLPKSLFLFVATAAALSGCGSSGISGVPDTTVQGQDNGQIVNPSDTGSGFGAYPLSFQTVGTTSKTLVTDPSTGVTLPAESAPLRTDSILRAVVTLDPASQNQYPAGSGIYSNYTANYGCATVAVSLKIEVNGTYQTLATVITGRLTAAGTSGCAGSVASQTIDFSPYLMPGHGNVIVTAQAMTSDVNCQQAKLYPYNYPYGYYQNVCSANPMQSIYQYHVVNGKVQAQVNGASTLVN